MMEIYEVVTWIAKDIMEGYIKFKDDNTSVAKSLNANYIVN